jgi:hypothetical protein
MVMDAALGSAGIVQVHDDEQGIQCRPRSGIQHTDDASNPRAPEGVGVMAGDPAPG